MNVVKCMNGHFFDSDTYAACPHCGAPVGGAQAAPAPFPVAEEKPHKKGLFHFGEKKNAHSQVPPQIPVSPMPEQEFAPPPYTPNPVSNVSASTPVSFVPPAGQIDTSVTLDMWQQSIVPQPEPDVPLILEEEPVAPAPMEPVVPIAPVPMEPVVPVALDPYAAPEIPAAPETSVVPAPPEAPVEPAMPVTPVSPLQAAVRQASATTEGKTMSFFSAMTASAASTSPEAASHPISDPVVGWLVCIGGKHFGESFQICAGKNSIGRSASNRIVLNREDSVSREKHALIVYEPKKRNFYLQPGDASGLTYLNEEYITESKKLSDRDIVELGDGKFLFVPLCGESFTWETYLTKE